MRIAGIIILLFGLIVGGCSAAASTVVDGERKTLDTLEEVDLGDLDGEQRGWVEGRTAVREGADPAPLTGKRVAWWKHESFFEWEEYDSCKSRNSDGDCRGGYETKTEGLEIDTSGDILVEVEGGSSVIVREKDLEQGEVDLKDREERRDPRRGEDPPNDDSEVVEEEEWLPAKQRVSVVGRFTPGKGEGAPARVRGIGSVDPLVSRSFEHRIDDLEGTSKFAFGFTIFGMFLAVVGVLLIVFDVRGRRRRATIASTGTVFSSSTATDSIEPPGPSTGGPFIDS